MSPIEAKLWVFAFASSGFVSYFLGQSNATVGFMKLSISIDFQEDDGKTIEILGEYKNASMLYMDATGEKVVIDTLFDRDFEFQEVRVQQQGNVKVYQFVNNASFSKSSFQNNPKNLDDLCEWVETLDTELLGFIRYKLIL